jgi:hypothetical protein
MEHVALLVAVLSSYGGTVTDAATSFDALLEDFPRILPGGIAVVSSDRMIVPGCCCGLESWPEWRKILTEGSIPWTGHDPAPLIEVVDDEVRVWSDGGAMGEQPNDEEPIVFGRDEFAEALKQVGQDLVGFLIPLRGWLDEHAADHAEGIARCFEERFVG